jgi:hypothetical protein
MTMYANKTTTLAIVAIVTAIALVAAGSITTSAVAARKHASKSDSLATTRGTGVQSEVIKQLIDCLTSLNGGVTRAAINDCVNNALGMGFGSSPSKETLSSNSDLMPSTATTSTMTGQ